MTQPAKDEVSGFINRLIELSREDKRIDVESILTSKEYQDILKQLDALINKTVPKEGEK